MSLVPKLGLGNTRPAKLGFAARETGFRGSPFPNRFWERELHQSDRQSPAGNADGKTSAMPP